mgnify:CR=1 FL=1
MRQKSFSSGFEKHTKQTRKEKFLGEMDQVIPWKELTQGLEPYYSNPRGAGRRPKGLERMPRIYFLQHGYLSDPAMEEDAALELTAEGEDEQQALDKLEQLIRDRFGEAE